MSARRCLLGVALVAMSGCSRTSEPLTIERARAAAAPMGADTSLYFDIRSTAGDRLVGARSDVATEVSLHEQVGVEGGQVMAAVAAVELPAGDVVAFEPLGDHVMLEDLTADLAPGAEITVVLSFDGHADVTVVVEVVALLDLVAEQ
ncbi:MAG: copper chaperone PCu(A)C [Desertimonas sp.]